MSALTGIFNWDGQAVMVETLDSLDEYSRVAGPHHAGRTSPRPGLALQVNLLHFDSWSAKERQPHHFAKGSVLTWDGRLDNRDDLLTILHHELHEPATDVVIVAAAYERWGVDCLPRLIGDWSLAVWDASTHTLLLACDYMANRPLYYRETPQGVAWASRLDALVECFQLYSHPSEAYIVGSLVGGRPRHQSPYAGVKVLAGGHRLTVSCDRGVSIQRYWTFSPGRIRYRDPALYADHLRVLMTDAVRVRLRANRTVWSHMSGGWDSGAIACLAHALVQHRCVEAPALQTVALRFSDSPECDEEPYIAALDRWCGFRTPRMHFEGLPIFPDLPSDGGPFDRAHYLCDALEAPVRQRGDHIVLSGELGDVVMNRSGGYPPPVLEPLHEGDPLQTLRLCLARARHRQQTLLWTLAAVLMIGYTPRWLLPKLSAWWLGRSKASLERVRLAPAMHVYASTPPPVSPDVSALPATKRWLAERIYDAAGTWFVSTSDRSPQVWRTFPFAHRPLVEFILAAPTLAFWDPVLFRAGMQRALPGVLPPEILRRTSKRGAAASFKRDQRRRYEAVTSSASRGDRPVRDWALVRQGYLEASWLAAALTKLSSNEDIGYDYEAIFAVEAWLRRLPSLREERRGTRIPDSRGTSTLLLDSHSPTLSA